VAGTYTLGSHFTLITAGSVTGQFAAVTDAAGNPLPPLSIFVAPAATYDATHAYLDVGVVKDFNTVAQTPNQTAAANGVQSIAGGNPLFTGNALYNAVAMSQTDAAARRAFDAVSGEIHASAKTLLIEDSRFVREAALDHLQQPVGNTFWVQAFGSDGEHASDQNAATASRNIAGVFLGADKRFGDWQVGALGGYSRSDIKVNDRGSTAKADAIHVGAYAGTQAGAVAIRLGAAYAWQNLQTDRSIAIAGGGGFTFADQLHGDYSARVAQVFGEMGYGIAASDTTTVEPYVNLAYVHLSTDQFAERGGLAALTTDSASNNATIATLGIRATENFASGTVFKGGIGYRHAFGDAASNSTFRLAGSAPFTVAGVPLSENYAVIDAGFDFVISTDSKLGIAYMGQFGSGIKDNGARVDIKVKF
jgi:outer membrane autotransporter protein